MFKAEHERLVSELEDVILNVLPQLLLPPQPDSFLPAMVTLTAGIGGGEAARFLEEMSKMYTRHSALKGWTVEVLNATEGAMAKGTGGNGYREMTLKILPNPHGEPQECFGELMWEKGTHRVQRVPPGATITKMHSSTVNVNVSHVLEF
jgi:peptide chain release factor 1